MESEELIQKVLKMSGILLTFPAAEIYGIPGFNISVLYKGEATVYEVEKQNFSFQVSTQDCVDNDIIIDNTFEIEDRTYVYTFKIDRQPIFDLSGWSKLHVNYISKVLV